MLLVKVTGVGATGFVVRTLMGVCISAMSNTLGVSKRGVKRVFFFFSLIEQYHWVLGIRVEKQLLKLLCPAYYVSWE